MLTKAFSELNIRLLVIIAAAFQLWDALITQVYVSNGIVAEGNPLMAPLIQGGLFLPGKIASIIFSVFLIYLLARFSTRIARRATTGIIMLYSVVLISNYSILLQA